MPATADVPLQSFAWASLFTMADDFTEISSSPFVNARRRARLNANARDPPIQASRIFIANIASRLRPRRSKCKHPQHATLRHIRLGAESFVEIFLFALCVDTPAGLHRDVLHAIDFVTARHTDDS